MEERVGKLTEVPLREIWEDEAEDFTTWLENNVEYLNEKMETILTIVSREKDIGPFHADLVAEDESGEKVVIENQLEKTDHDHLGKLITYMSNLEASTAVWITSEPKQEHTNAVDWLNEIGNRTGMKFYLVKIESYKIGDSLPAPYFSIIAGPSEEAETIGKEKEEDVERLTKRKEFWEKLLEKAEDRLPLYSNVSPSKDHWLSAGAGKAGIHYNFLIYTRGRGGGIQLVISRGKDSRKENKEIFDELHSHRDEIEQEFGERITWRRLDSKKSSRLEVKYDIGGLYQPEKWDELQEKMINGMKRFEDALKKHIVNLKL
ncbi:hypothetical protein AKJ43_03435 [candidate division MSBL1 archaeon SCGC-AAA261D19]|uniref:DUF4268 domain-containing protein n=3 Tax=candidate division MSBL1 TaxID=215777 RepID=A0A133V010_9EURY|nr:hypothetical protein AKJ42_02550 [candidate division MSBL1 archaeon SCGC-AAA261C02]KXB01352.1 hypothetical protein AKJ43_03435 [candidate division MSBL1 archaeon SCGC-AAA261D19]KXB03167.1 hypothetical protein AKJ48_04160 [candidate division MSBL1 archaeon SCGC-AAA261O19]